MDYYYDERLAEDPIIWIEDFCVHYIGEKKGQPFLLEEYQKEPLRELFGWRHKEKPQYLKYSTFWFEVPRGDGKSTFGTAIGLYIALAAGIKSSRVYCFASSKEQSKESVFEPAKFMCEDINDKHDAGLLLYHSHVEDPTTNSTFRLMSSDYRSGHSLVGSAFIIDEIHLHANGKLFGGIDSGAAKRTDCTPLKIILTTSGEVDTFGHGQHVYARGVKEGTIVDNSYLVRIFTAGEAPSDDPGYYFREETWKIANPGWDHINQVEFKRKAERAKNSKAFLNNFLRYNLNVWVGSSNTFIPEYEWNQCNRGVVPLEDLRGQECFAGLYFMHVRDIIAFTLFFPAQRVIKRWFWCPKAMFIERENIDSRWTSWKEAGFIRIVSGNAHDFNDPMEVISDIVGRFRVQSFEYRCREAIFIDKLGQYGVKMSAYTLTHGQISAPTTKLEEMIINKDINHEGNPVADYMIRCVDIKIKDDQVKMVPGADIIPGPLADVLSIAGWMNVDQKKSVYEGRGIRTV